ncbi:MAG: MazG family protein [Deltaproteobacteria bacterium]|nr:MazG family protein [Deltaproteobacteria bacterium]
MSQNKKTGSDYKYNGFQGLINIVGQLRSENGCPWDKKQTEETLKPYILEEAYEVIEALDSQDTGEISEELGDLLLQVVFISQIYAEKKIFSIEDVIEKINNKLLRRHPHVFDKTFSLKEGECLDDVILENWEEIKKQEKKHKKQNYTENSINNKSNNNGDNEDGNNNLNINNIINSSIYVIKNMPALHRAYMIQEKASRQGFDFSSIDEALDKISEETSELKKEIENYKSYLININKIKDSKSKLLNNLNNNIGYDKNTGRNLNLNNNIDKNEIDKVIKKDNYVLNDNENNINKIIEEYGDLLFSIVNIGRLLDLHPCDALNKASDKFVKRFHYIESQLASVHNSDIKSTDTDVLNNLWEEAKKFTE